MVTMKDIAKKSGVSQATVSRVISGNVSVNPEIKRKVMEWVRKLDYKPNIIAQSLVKNKSLLIGVIITDISNPFFSDVIKSVESEAAKYGYSIILCNTDWNLDKEKKYISIMKSYNVDGILIVPSNAKDTYFKSLKNINIPIVVITQNIDGFNCVSISHYLSAKDVAKHLISMGYSKFVFVGFEEDEKCRGFKDEIESSGFKMENDFFAVSDKAVNTDLKELLESDLKNEDIGIFAYNDIEALVVLHLLKEMKVEIPEKIALVGFDNTFISKEVSPTLSSVAQPIEEIGRQSVEILIDNICGKKDVQEKHIIIEPRLVVRESSVKSVAY
ncbi:LacI family DNA-binding transcriptional regulator [Clostridium felsineum]|uniref:HTH-type transcriptional regulator DegA n=1 Tax=Clostridium felsineum TaxID=36839 RepID=A0A1S8MCA3_9CLOT|nr:LacI family DNA-binding transcriptional regulator [Clostridium felsineum]URZ04985.1 HTH-type transcriptional regulator DegA [Clostridium felsineum]URZ10026.1 HTH-type transcriptional regulator DegA [Clostridium felsineum]